MMPTRTMTDRLARAPRARMLAGTALVVLSMSASGVGDEVQAMPHMSHKAAVAAGSSEHAHHGSRIRTGYVRSVASYKLPEVTLVDTKGKPVPLASLLDVPEPVLLNFIFTSCTTICPVLSATFSQVQTMVGDQHDRLNMVSISIDPEHDTPARLDTYAARFDAGRQWRFLTGSLSDIVTVQKAFDAYRGEKMSHVPLTFLRSSPSGPWVRIEGFASAAELVGEYQALIARR